MKHITQQGDGLVEKQGEDNFALFNGLSVDIKSLAGMVNFVNKNIIILL
jgi:hypothetical protein